MKSIVPTSLCAALVACATTVIVAQTTSAPQTSTATTDQKTIVVTGCLKEAPSSSMPSPPSPPAPTGTTGTTGAAGGPSDATPSPKYVLTNATTSPGDTSGAAANASTYKLIANASALTPHVGKKVELTGTLEPAGSGNSEATTTTDANANGPTLRVQAGKI